MDNKVKILSNHDLIFALRVGRDEVKKIDTAKADIIDLVIKKIDDGEWTLPTSIVDRSDILDAAKKCVCGKREQDYGTPESNFQLIANLWNAYLDDRDDNISPTDVAMMMGLMKIARIRNGGGTGDSFVDLAGYAACGGEINNNIKFMNYVRGWTAKEMEKVGTEVQKSILSGTEEPHRCGNCKYFYKDFSEEPCNSCSKARMDNDILQWEAMEAKEDDKT